MLLDKRRQGSLAYVCIAIDSVFNESHIFYIVWLFNNEIIYPSVWEVEYTRSIETEQMKRVS